VSFDTRQDAVCIMLLADAPHCVVFKVYSAKVPKRLGAPACGLMDVRMYWRGLASAHDNASPTVSSETYTSCMLEREGLVVQISMRLWIAKCTG
jgi:hypothetical protein